MALSLTLAGTISLVSDPANAQAEDHGKITTVSRAVKVFGQFEHSLDAALSASDQAMTNKLLAANFEQRLASNPGEPVTREEWLKGEKPASDTRFDQMSVHDHGTVAVASFFRITPASEADQPEQRTFVVDVWKKNGDDWQLDTRYQADAGTAAVTTDEDIKPSGKG
jgi:hypothetical protein